MLIMHFTVLPSKMIKSVKVKLTNKSKCRGALNYKDQNDLKEIEGCEMHDITDRQHRASDV